MKKLERYAYLALLDTPLEYLILQAEKDFKRNALLLGAAVLLAHAGALITKAYDIKITLLSLAVFAMAYAGRFDKYKNEFKRTEEAFNEALPELMLQLIILLNAGLVCDAAFAELCELNKDDSAPLYKALRYIREQSESMHLSFARQMYIYARSSRQKEFIRFANLVMEHERAGSELAEKLERERNMQLDQRINTARAKAKEAETKLCIPLMLLLLALIVISSAPALMMM